MNEIMSEYLERMNAIRTHPRTHTYFEKDINDKDHPVNIDRDDWYERTTAFCNFEDMSLEQVTEFLDALGDKIRDLIKQEGPNGDGWKGEFNKKERDLMTYTLLNSSTNYGIREYLAEVRKHLLKPE